MKVSIKVLQFSFMSYVNYISLCGLNGFQDVVDMLINISKFLRLINIMGQITPG